MSDHKNEDKTDDKGEDRYTVPALARGLQLLMEFNREDRELTEEEEKARREAAGIKTRVPPRDTKKKKGG